jgi:MFS family permease
LASESERQIALTLTKAILISPNEEVATDRTRVPCCRNFVLQPRFKRDHLHPVCHLQEVHTNVTQLSDDLSTLKPPKKAPAAVGKYGARTRAALERWREARVWMRAPTSKRSRFGLDWLNFFMADVETGFGTFVALYLANQGWSKALVGLALGAGQIASVIGQIPGGALIDATSRKRIVAAIGIAMILSAALIYALLPITPLVFLAEIFHGLASGLVQPAIAAISLGLVGRHAMSSRTGRNYRFNSAGNALTAIIMGLVGSYVSVRAIFFAAAGLCVPALIGLFQIRSNEIDNRRARNSGKDENDAGIQSVRAVALNQNVLLFTVSLVLFQFADASMLPLIAENLGASQAGPASIMTAGLIAAPQLVMVLLAPWVGYISESVGRKPLLLAGFAVEAARGIFLAVTREYWLLVFAQALSGITAAIVGVLTVLIITDLTTATGRFNITRGAVLTCSSLAASASVAASGFLVEALGHYGTFLLLAAIAICATSFAWAFVAESKPAEYLD